jgi:hypothetical protein
MTVSFQVGDREFGGSGNLEIDFWVCSELVQICAIGTNNSILNLFWLPSTFAEYFHGIGRRPPIQPPVLQTSHLLRRLLVHRAPGRKIRLLLQQ